MTNTNTNTILQDLRRYIAYHREIGIPWYPALPEFQQLQPGGGKTVVPASEKKVAPPLPSAMPSAKTKGPAPEKLADIISDRSSCAACPLCREGGAAIFGEGNPQARLVIVLDFPTREDAAQGRLLGGPAGELFDRMLKAIGLSRQDIYLTSLLKCPPVEDKIPADQEARHCLALLIRQLRAIDPGLVCAMGGLAAQALTRSPKSIFRLRGQSLRIESAALPLIVTFSPEYLLSHEEMKKPAWADLQMVQRALR